MLTNKGFLELGISRHGARCKDSESLPASPTFGIISIKYELNKANSTLEKTMAKEKTH